MPVYFFKNAFCDATFQLRSGTLIGAGALNFSSQTFAMSITGGTGAYSGLSGDVELTPHGATRNISSSSSIDHADRPARPQDGRPSAAAPP